MKQHTYVTKLARPTCSGLILTNISCSVSYRDRFIRFSFSDIDCFEKSL